MSMSEVQPATPEGFIQVGTIAKMSSPLLCYLPCNDVMLDRGEHSTYGRLRLWAGPQPVAFTCCQ